jgi:hypothetical protein
MTVTFYHVWNLFHIFINVVLMSVVLLRGCHILRLLHCMLPSWLH